MMRHIFSLAQSTLLPVVLLLAALILPVQAQGDQVIFDDAVRSGWENWSWAKTNIQNSQPMRGARSMRAQAAPWTAIYWHRAAFDTSPYESFSSGFTVGRRAVRN